MFFGLFPTAAHGTPAGIGNGFSSDLGPLAFQGVRGTQGFSQQRVETVLITKESTTQELDRRVQESGGTLFVGLNDPLYSYMDDILKKNPDKYTPTYTHGDYGKTGWTISLGKDS